MIVYPIDYGTPEFDETVALRTKILRIPLGLEFTEEQLSMEYSDTHIVCRNDKEQLLGCLILTPKDDNKLKMRQVAVDDVVQSKGVGSKIVEWSEEWGRKQGFKEMVLNARKTAVPFYLKLNYVVEGEEFTEVGIPYLFMKKMLV